MRSRGSSTKPLRFTFSHQSGAYVTESARRTSYSGGETPPSACMASTSRDALRARVSASAADRSSPRVLKKAGGASATSRAGSKQRRRGAVARVGGARHEWRLRPTVTWPVSRKSHSPPGRSLDTWRKWWRSRRGSRSWPPSQQRPRSVEAVNQRSRRASRGSTVWTHLDRADRACWRGRNTTSVALARAPTPAPPNQGERLIKSGSSASRPHLLSWRSERCGFFHSRADREPIARSPSTHEVSSATRKRLAGPLGWKNFSRRSRMPSLRHGAASLMTCGSSAAAKPQHKTKSGSARRSGCRCREFIFTTQIGIVC
mmetsp:Transcript_2413/g.7105  ORF Transcript_2413/g.7105 Transcript_2413/m.7105 type:complete len:316 (+) Transcript_2413:653-1600(+)